MNNLPPDVMSKDNNAATGYISNITLQYFLHFTYFIAKQ